MRARWQVWIGLTLVVVIAGGIIAYLETRPPGQLRVNAGVLPIVAGADRVATFVDCSKLDAITYIPENPCETFVLVADGRFPSAEGLLEAEARRLLSAGWRQTPAQLVDYDAGSDAREQTARRGESWMAPDHGGCAYVATAESGSTLEGRFLLPYDPYDGPRGLLDFYRRAKAMSTYPSLWIRLRPQFGKCAD